VRVGEAYWTISAVRGGQLNWDALIAAARATGLLLPLACHLHSVNQIHERVCGRPLLDASIGSRLPHGQWGDVHFRGGAYRGPSAHVSGLLYLQQLRVDLSVGDWAAAARLCFLPVVAASVGWRRLAGANPRGE
jgi:hypothetical protein